MPGPYAFDPELQPIIDILPENDFTDVEAARKGLDDIIGMLSRDVDETGVRYEDRHVPGPEGAPEVLVRVVHARTSVRRPVRPCSTSTAAASSSAPWRWSTPARSPSPASSASSWWRWSTGSPPSTRSRPGSRTATPRCSGCTPRPASWASTPTRIGLYGQSAGGGLAAGLALLARDRGGPAAVLPVPRHPRARRPARDRRACGHFTDTPDVEPAGRRSSAGSATSAATTARTCRRTRRPPGPRTCAGCPRPTSRRWSSTRCATRASSTRSRLMQAGVQVELHSFPGTFHGSALLPTAAVSKRASTEMMDALRRGLKV